MTGNRIGSIIKDENMSSIGRLVLHAHASCKFYPYHSFTNSGGDRQFLSGNFWNHQHDKLIFLSLFQPAQPHRIFHNMNDRLPLFRVKRADQGRDALKLRLNILRRFFQQFADRAAEQFCKLLKPFKIK